MLMRKALPCLIAAGIVAIAGCNKGGPAGSGPGVVAADDPLTYVPADTPYVIANIDPQPKAVSDDWIGKIDKAGKLGDTYAQQIDTALMAIAREGAACSGGIPVASDANSGGGGGMMQDDAAASASSDPFDAGAGSSASDATDGAASAASDGDDAGGMQVVGGDESAAEQDKCSTGAIADRAKATKLLGAVKDEVAGKDVKGLMDLFGISPQMHAAFYGIGLVPVLRIELAKPDNLRATIGRVEAKSGAKLDTGKVAGLDYWSVGGNDGKIKLVFAISGKQFVGTIAPAKASDADLKALFGIDKPAKSLAASGDLQTLNQKMKYLSFGSGYFDSAKLVAELKAPPTPLETSFLAAIGEKKPQIDATCAAEYDQLAAAWPRASFGYTELSTQHMALRGVIEARADIAKDLKTLSAPMPGMEAAKTAMLDFGFSMNLGKLPELAAKYAKSTAASPWKCPALAGLNESAEKANTALTNPGFAGYAGMFNGLHLIADKITLKDDQPIPDIAAVAVVGSGNPASLLAMAGNLVPSIASLGLKPDGTPKALPAIPNLPIQAPMWAAMTDKTLAIALGAGEDARIADAMKSDPAQQPLFAGGASGDFYHVLAGFMRKSAQSLSDEQAKKTLEQQAKMMDMYAGFFKRAAITIDLTDQGVELHESVDLQ